MTNPTDEHFLARLKALITAAVNNLDPADREERINYCRDHDEHGVRLHVDDHDDILELRWGGRTLAMVNANDLASDQPLRPEFVDDTTPDTLPDEWSQP